MDRIIQKHGRGNIIVVAPHGHRLDDVNSEIMTAACADYLNAPAIINVGWKRDEQINPDLGIANCNDIRHCRNEAVEATFLGPLYQQLNIAKNNFRVVIAVLLHGMADDPQDRELAIMLGLGHGKQCRITCDLDWKDKLVRELHACDLKTIESKSGKFAAHSKHNLTQAIHRDIPCVQTIQMEVAWHLRRTQQLAECVGIKIGRAIEKIR